MEKISYSSIASFRMCPKKYYYQYIENFESIFAIALELGDLFHQMVAAYYRGESDKVEEINEIYMAHVAAGRIDKDIDLLSYMLRMYVGYYEDSDKEETILGIEKEYLIDWDKGTKFHAFIDKIVEKDGLIKIRDTKTTSRALKMTHSDVQNHVQLNTYAAVVEEAEGIKADSLEIDEVRLEKLTEVPVTMKGRPSTDKNKLSLVTFDQYYNKLVDMKLDTAPEYQSTLDYLKTRGHPLFRRIHVLRDDQLVSSTINDVYSTFRIIEALEKSPTLVYPRHTQLLCGWCDFQEICRLDQYDPTDRDREIVWAKKLRIKVDKELDK